MWAGAVPLATGYKLLNICYHGSCHEYSDLQLSPLHDIVGTSGYVMDYIRCKGVKLSPYVSSSTASYQITDASIHNLESMLVCMVPHAYGTSRTRDKFRLGEGSSYGIVTEANRTGFKDLDVIIGDTHYPSEIVDWSSRSLQYWLDITKDVYVDGTDIQFADTLMTPHFWAGLSDTNHTFVGHGASFFHVGLDFKSSTALRSGVSLATTPMIINLTFKGTPESTTVGPTDNVTVSSGVDVYVFLLYEAELTVMADKVILKS
jgi:hypothetical protein